MKIIYTPEGGSKRTWEFEPENPPWDVTYGTEKATGWPWGEFTNKLAQGSVIALQALIWVLRKRDEPKLARDSVTPLWGDVDIEEDDDVASDEQVQDPAGPEA